MYDAEYKRIRIGWVFGFSDLERQILTSGLSLTDITETVDEFRTNGTKYILAMYRDIARKCMLTMMRLRCMTDGVCFHDIGSAGLVDKLSRPIDAARRHITFAERVKISQDLQLLFRFLSNVQQSINITKPQVSSQIDDLVAKMRDVSLLPFVPDEDSSEQTCADDLKLITATFHDRLV